MIRIAVAGAMALALAGCGGSDTVSAGAANGFVPPDAQEPSPIVGQAHSNPLTVYVGKYPSDAVGGVSFYDRTEVANSLIAAVGDPGIRRLMTSHEATQTPIFSRDGRLGAHGCEAHNCGDHNWTLFVPLAGSAGQACYHDAKTMGDTSQWYANGPPVKRPGDCPGA